MSTSNFCNFEASKYYAIGSDPNDQFIYDYTKDNVYNEVKKLVKEKRYSLRHCNENKMYHQLFNRNYGGKYICNIEHSKDFGDIEITLTFYIVLSGAYYQGATLDYISEIQINGDDNGDKEAFDKNFMPSDLQYYSEMPIGMQIIQSKNIKKFVSSAYDEMTEQIEKIFEKHCEHKLVCTAVFSNGEAIYSKVS